MPRQIGFKNPHNICFLTSVMQGLLATNPMVKLMGHLLHVREDIPPSFKVLKGLAEVAHDIQTATSTVSSLPLEPCLPHMHAARRSCDGVHGSSS